MEGSPARTPSEDCLGTIRFTKEQHSKKLLPWFLWAALGSSWIAGTYGVVVGLLAMPFVLVAILSFGISVAMGRQANKSAVLGLTAPLPGWVSGVLLLCLPVIALSRLSALPLLFLFPNVGLETQQLPMGFAAAIGRIVTIPLAEEILYRGFLLGLFESEGRVTSLLVTSLLFGMAHDLPNFVPAVVAGWVLAWVAQRYGSIYPAILLHALYNSSSYFLSYLGGHGLYAVALYAVLAVYGLAVIVGAVKWPLMAAVFVKPWVGSGLERPWSRLARTIKMWPVTIWLVQAVISWASRLFS